ncbi:MAG: OFA family MFS transporter [Oscillospiraceae bacterium]|jgi:OFA family oxalate/formate antiporter-like MFS transporter|nr:OFA family MFS transporter [Oscillospiraceae bacterium]
MSNAKTVNRTGVLIRALIILFMGGVVNSAAVFVSPLAAHYGWTVESIAGVATFMALMQTPGHILSGWMMGKFGGKTTLMVGCVLLGLAFFLSSFVPAGSPWMLYVTFSVLQGLGVGFTYTGGTYCATGWYPDKRGLASGLCMAFNGGAATFLAPLIARLIVVMGIKVTLLVVGVAIIVIGLTAAVGLKAAPVGYIPEGWSGEENAAKMEATQLESLKPNQVFKTRAYWHFFLAMGFFPTMYIICYPRFSVLIQDAGFSLSAATIGVSIYSIANVGGRLLMGALIDKIGYRKVYLICGISSVASSVCLMFANSLPMFYIAYILLGIGFGATNCCHPVAMQETFGSQYAGGVFGVCMLGYMLICTFLSPRISSALVASTGDYTASMIYAIVGCIIAVAMYTTIPLPKRRTLAEVEAEENAK